VLVAIPLLLAISFVTFMFIHMAPGNYFDTLRMNPLISQETIRHYEKTYHLDKPPIVQYIFWLRNLARFDLGYSFVQMMPVATVLKSRLFNTLILSVSSLLLTWILALPLGIFAAVHRHRWPDRLFSSISFLGLSIPNFFLALLLLYLVSITGILPLGGMRSAGFENLSPLGKILDCARHLVIPSVVIATSAMAGLQRIMRGNMLEVLRAQYIIAARARGLPESRVIYVHALRNAINPLITIFGYQLSGLLSGAALTEIITGWPGLGSIMLTAVRSQDLFLVMGSMLVGGVMLIAGNLVADILLAWADPRIRY
jgi:peptide/nickel transport system permease protein